MRGGMRGCPGRWLDRSTKIWAAGSGSSTTPPPPWQGRRFVRSVAGVFGPAVLAVLVPDDGTIPHLVVVVHVGRQHHAPSPGDHPAQHVDGKVLLDDDAPLRPVFVGLEVAVDHALATLRATVVDEDPHAPDVGKVALHPYQRRTTLAVLGLAPVPPFRAHRGMPGGASAPGTSQVAVAALCCECGTPRDVSFRYAGSGGDALGERVPFCHAGHVLLP